MIKNLSTPVILMVLFFVVMIPLEACYKKRKIQKAKKFDKPE